MNVRSHCGRRAEAGESLIEILLTVMVIGTTFTALLFAAGAAVDASRFHKKQVEAQAYLRQWAESIERNSDAYVDCPGATPAVITSAPAAPPAITPQTVVVEAWNGTAFVKCSAVPSAADPGWQRITLEVKVKPGALPAFSQKLFVVLRHA